MNTNGDVSSARNVSLDAVTGEFIIFFNSDNTINKEMLETMANVYKDNSPIIVGSKYYHKM